MKLTKKDKATLQEVFRHGMLHIFDTDEEAYRIRAILGKHNILHTLGEYLKDKNGDMAYHLGIEIAKPAKFIQQVFDGQYGEIGQGQED